MKTKLSREKAFPNVSGTGKFQNDPERSGTFKNVQNRSRTYNQENVVTPVLYILKIRFNLSSYYNTWVVNKNLLYTFIRFNKSKSVNWSESQLKAYGYVTSLWAVLFHKMYRTQKFVYWHFLDTCGQCQHINKIDINGKRRSWSFLNYFAAKTFCKIGGYL